MFLFCICRCLQFVYGVVSSFCLCLRVLVVYQWGGVLVTVFVVLVWVESACLVCVAE